MKFSFTKIRLFELIDYWSFTVLFYLGIVIFLWLPYGLNIWPTWDVWSSFTNFDEGGSFARVDIAYEFYKTRILAFLPWYLGWIIDNGSFMGVNLVWAVVCFGKGLIITLIVLKLLPGYLTTAFLSGVLFILCPSQLAMPLHNLNVFNLHTSILFYLLAANFMISYYQTNSKTKLTLMTFSLFLSVSIYDVVLPLLWISPFILFFFKNKPHSKVFNLLGCWYAITVIWTGLFIHAISVESYTSGYLRDGTTGIILGFNNIYETINYVYANSLWRGFTTAIHSFQSSILFKSTTEIKLPMIILGTLSGLIVWFYPDKIYIKENKFRINNSSIILIGSLIIMYVGYVMYAPTHGRFFSRTLIAPSIGSSIAISLFINKFIILNKGWKTIVYIITFIIFSERSFNDLLTIKSISIFIMGMVLINVNKKLMLSSVVALIVSLSFYIAMEKNEEFLRLTIPLNKVSYQIVEKIPWVKPGTNFFLIEVNNDFLKDEDTVSDIMPNVLKYIYEDLSLGGYMFAYDDQTQETVRGGLEGNISCIFKEKGISLYRNTFNDTRELLEYIPYEKTIILLFNGKKIEVPDRIPDKFLSDISGTTYGLEDKIKTDVPYPNRFHTIFHDWALGQDY